MEVQKKSAKARESAWSLLCIPTASSSVSVWTSLARPFLESVGGHVRTIVIPQVPLHYFVSTHYGWASPLPSLRGRALPTRPNHFLSQVYTVLLCKQPSLASLIIRGRLENNTRLRPSPKSGTPAFAVKMEDAFNYILISSLIPIHSPTLLFTFCMFVCSFFSFVLPSYSEIDYHCRRSNASYQPTTVPQGRKKL